MINPQLDARIATWQAEWMELHRMPIPLDPRGAQEYRERASYLLGVAYVLLSDARHDSDASASVMGRIAPIADDLPGIPYPLQIAPESAADTYPQRSAYGPPVPGYDPLARPVPETAEQFQRGLAEHVAYRGEQDGRPAEARQ